MSSIIQERRKDTEGSTKAKRKSRIQGTGGCLISTDGTAAVVRWEIEGGRIEDLK